MTRTVSAKAERGRSCMKKKFLPITLITTILVCLMCVTPLKVHAADIITVPITGRYRQTESRAMLDMINQFRTGSDAWYLKKDNTKYYATGLKRLNYDYVLEKVAMQRAAEIAVIFSHGRPNGNKYDSAYPSDISYSAKGENIACYSYQSTAQEVFTDWKEDNDQYAGQGHRRNMLSNKFDRVGIACFVYDGKRYWVQEFGQTSLLAPITNANDSQTTVNVDLAAENIQSTSILDTESTYPSSRLDLYFGNPYDCSNLEEHVSLVTYLDGKVNPGSFNYPIKSFSVKDSSIAQIQNGKLVAVKVGKTEISMTSSFTGKTMTIPVEVHGNNINNAYCSLEDNNFYYTGRAITPAVTLRYYGVALQEGTDYTLSYKNNTEPGPATIIITGKTAFEGTSRTLNFTILSPFFSSQSISMPTTTYTYTGKAIIPSFSISYNGQTLKEGTDYRVSYTNNIDVGTATMYVTGINKFSGSSFAKTFTITKKDTPSGKNPKKKGTTFNYSFGTYKVTSSSTKNPAVTLVKVNTNPKSLSIPDKIYDNNNVAYKVTAISATACKSKTKLKTLTVGKNVTSIGKNAFNKCKKLEFMTLPSTNLKIGKNAYKGIKSKAKIKIKSGTKTAKKKLVTTINKTGGAKNAKLN